MCSSTKTVLNLLHVIRSITFARKRKIADRIASVNQALTYIIKYTVFLNKFIKNSKDTGHAIADISLYMQLSK
jgi:hypothetical protein